MLSITLPADIAADVPEGACVPWICMKLLWQHGREACYLQHANSLRHTADDWHVITFQGQAIF